LLMVVLALIYYLFPNIDQPFRIITLGTVVAVIAWLAASLGFSFYVNNLASYSTLYGNLTAIIVLQLYIYISASIILFGAEVNEQIYREFTEEGQNGDEELRDTGSPNR
jgi:membrane protein